MDYIRAEGDFPKEIYTVDRTNKAETRPVNGELSDQEVISPCCFVLR